MIPTDLTLSGTADDVFIFQIAQNLTMSNAMKIHLIGGATARNIFWQVAGDVAIGTTAHFEGVILCQTAITLGTGATISGDLYAQTAVHLDSNGVAKASPAGTSVYGTGTPGCSGILWMNANVPPRINTLDFAILCSNVPTSSLGLGLVTDSQDLEGSFLFGWGILIHIDLIGSTQVLSYDMTSSSNGVGYSPIPIPNNPALIGNTYYTQCFWLQKPGDDCKPFAAESRELQRARDHDSAVTQSDHSWRRGVRRLAATFHCKPRGHSRARRLPRGAPAARLGASSRCVAGTRTGTEYWQWIFGLAGTFSLKWGAG